MKEFFDAIPLESIQTLKNRVVAAASLRLLHGDDTVYSFFENDIHNIFSDRNRIAAPPGIPDVTDEIKTIDFMTGINMQAIKNSLRDSGNYNHFENIINIQDKRFAQGFSRNYIVNAVRYKREHKRSCLSKAITALIGANTITLIIDASNLKMTEIRKNSEEGFENIRVEPPPQTVDGVEKKYVNLSGTAVPLRVNILSSSENESDSAGKIAYNSYAQGENTNVQISIFKDLQETLSYPPFASADPSQNANIYASIPFTTHRGSGDEKQPIRGEFMINDTTKVVVDDLKNESQIATASFKAVQLYLEAYGRADVDDVKMKEILVQFLIKRIGDWAQGLCLLDLYRLYRIIEGEGNREIKRTLEDIKGDGEMGVLTHDQVLLSYCILIGVDVFFTIHFPAGDHWLLHFKNNATRGRTTEEKIKAEIDALVVLEKNIQDEINDTTNYIAETTAKISALAAAALFREYIGGLYITSSNLQNHTSLAKLQELKVSLDHVKELIVGTNTEDQDGQRKLLSSSILRNTITGTITQNKDIRKITQITGREKDALDNLINAIRRGGNITVTIAYQNYMEKLVYPIRDAIKAIKATGIEYPSREMPLDASSFEIVAGTRVAYISDNLKNIKKTLDIMVPPAGGQAGGGRKALNDIFYDIRDRSIIVVKNKEPASIRDITYSLPKIPPTTIENSRIEEKSPETLLENFKAIQGEYVSDRNMNLYSVLDRYLITEDDRHKFEHLDTVTGPDRSTYQYKYCLLRSLLLDHDKLYTKYVILKAEYRAEKNDIETEIHRKLESLLDDVNKLGSASDEIFNKRFGLFISGTLRGNSADITFAIGRRLLNIRYHIFKNYMTTPKQSPYSYKNLEAEEVKEAANILKSITDIEKQRELSEDYEEFKKLDEAEQKAISDLMSLSAQGGRRRTRRAKKHPKRKTRRHKK